MSIQDLLEAHHEWGVDVDYGGRQDAVTCPCGWRELLGLHAGAQHRAHVAQMLIEHLQPEVVKAQAAALNAVASAWEEMEAPGAHHLYAKLLRQTANQFLEEMKK